jgi:plasmid stabilization system protein ParE
MRLRLSARAASDLREILGYLDTQNPTAAKTVRSSIWRALDIVRSFPAIGVAQRRGVRKYVVPQFPYLIYYSVAQDEQEIRIIAIRHAARRPFLTP